MEFYEGVENNWTNLAKTKRDKNAKMQNRLRSHINAIFIINPISLVSEEDYYGHLDAGGDAPAHVLICVKSFSSRGYKLLRLSSSRDNNNNYETAGAEESKSPFSR